MNVRFPSAVAAILIHAIALVVTAVIPLSDPPVEADAVELRFQDRTREPLPRISGKSNPLSTSEGTPVRPSPPRPSANTITTDNRSRNSDILPATVPEEDHRRDFNPTVGGLTKPSPMELRSVLSRGLRPEQAWELLEKLLDDYPQYRETVLREMIAGSGLPADSVQRVEMQYDRIFKNGIKPSWGAQRQVIEDAFRSYDPVHGWTNKGSYGPSINYIGLILFLIDLIEGK